jgi:hypothetical protein
MLDVPTAKLGAVQAERFRAEQRDALRLDLAQIAQQGRAVTDRLARVAEQDVAELMERRLRRHRIDRVNRDRPAAGESERIAVGEIERNFANIKRGESASPVPFRQGRRRHLAALGLRVHKPMRLEGEACIRLGLFGAVVARDRAPHRERHPEPQRPLAASDMPAELLPSLIGRERPEGQTALRALHRGQ